MRKTTTVMMDFSEEVVVVVVRIRLGFECGLGLWE